MEPPIETLRRWCAKLGWRMVELPGNFGGPTIRIDMPGNDLYVIARGKSMDEAADKLRQAMYHLMEEEGR